MAACMYCGLVADNVTHVCKACEDAAKKLDEERKCLIEEGEKEQARRAFYED